MLNKRMGIGALGAGLLLASAPVATAQALGPASAAAIVDVQQDTDSGNCVNVGMKFDTRLLADGGEAPFEIPAGQVLVVRQIELLGFGAAPGDGVQTRIFRGVGFRVNLAAIRESIADGSGRIFQIYQFDPGLVVASGGEVCTNNNLNITTTGILRGYLAPG
jgi:hypothetical protein